MGISSLAVVLHCPLLFLLLLSEDFIIDWRYKELQRLFFSSVGSDCLKGGMKLLLLQKFDWNTRVGHIMNEREELYVIE